MCGPTGVGILYGKKELLDKLEPGFFGGSMVSSISGDATIWMDSPARFEAGTPNIAGAIGLAAAAKYLRVIGIENIHKKIQELTKELIQELKKPWTLIPWCDHHVRFTKSRGNTTALLQYRLEMPV